MGKTGIHVSEIVFGGVEIEITNRIGIKSVKDMLPEEKAIELLYTALEESINFFDTTRMYGNSENLIGRAFRDKRNVVILTTKCVHLLNDDRNLPSCRKLKKKITTSLYDSLEYLQPDHVDFFMPHHSPVKVLENDEIISIFSALKERGIFKKLDASTYTKEETRITIKKNFWNMTQLPLNLMDQRQSTCIEKAPKKRIEIVIRSVHLKGLLSSSSGKYHHPKLKNVEKHLEQYKLFLEVTNQDFTSFATKFTIFFPKDSVLIVNIKNEYMELAFEAVDNTYLNAMDRK